eukprot:10963356-Lingulodinium_polyedra.AAC.1
MNDEVFWRRLRCLHSCVAIAERARTWGGGCDCHAEDLLAGKSVSCPLKGRRLRQAGAKVAEVRSEINRKARSFTVAAAEGDAS